MARFWLELDFDTRTAADSPTVIARVCPTDMDQISLNRDELLAELDRLRSENIALITDNQALRESRDESQREGQRYRLITENTLDLIGEVSQHGVYTYVSPNHQELLGYKPKELLGQNFSTLVHGADVDDVVEKFTRLRHRGRAVRVPPSGSGTRTEAGAGWRRAPSRSKRDRAQARPPTRARPSSFTAT